MKDKIFKILPVIIQEILISIYNYKQNKVRYSNEYYSFLKEFKKNDSLDLTELLKIQEERFSIFLKKVIEGSLFFSNYPIVSINEIEKLPILDKEVLRENLDSIYSIKKSEGVVSKTGGTTGKSLEVIFTKENIQERFAMLDNFRGRYGYKLGEKTAWFSGKDLISKRDIKNKIFWKSDYLYNTKYYSTFHIKDEYLKYYVEDMIKYPPEFIVGFPSSILDIAKYGLKHGYSFPPNICKAVFPTAETISVEMREKIGDFFKTTLFDQYASSEGAPFIFECREKKLHLELQSGVFEVLDENNQASSKGRLIVTSFTTEGCPLIRYDIGDNIEMENSEIICKCGNKNPLVKRIDGRIDDFIYSPENGKLNLGNVSNTLKDTFGIVKFQAIQNTVNRVDLKIVVDDKSFNLESKEQFIKNWRARIGEKMELKIQIVEEIPNEKSGKYRIVKNNIKHLL